MQVRFKRTWIEAAVNGRTIKEGTVIDLAKLAGKGDPDATFNYLTGIDMIEPVKEEKKKAENGNDASLSVECPKCGALAGEPCITPSGDVAKKSHADRKASE